MSTPKSPEPPKRRTFGYSVSRLLPHSSTNSSHSSGLKLRTRRGLGTGIPLITCVADAEDVRSLGVISCRSMSDITMLACYVGAVAPSIRGADVFTPQVLKRPCWGWADASRMPFSRLSHVHAVTTILGRHSGGFNGKKGADNKGTDLFSLL